MASRKQQWEDATSMVFGPQSSKHIFCNSPQLTRGFYKIILPLNRAEYETTHVSLNQNFTCVCEQARFRIVLQVQENLQHKTASSLLRLLLTIVFFPSMVGSERCKAF